MVLDTDGLSLLIRTKLSDGRLPVNRIPRVWGGQGNGETCDACEHTVSKAELLMEGTTLADDRKPIQLHTKCFYLWDKLRRL